MADPNEESYIDGEEPEVEVEPDGRVSLKGEEIPDSVKPLEDSIVSEEPAKVEEPEKPALEDTAEEIQLSEAEKAFAQDERLVKRYGSLEEMINRYGETDKYVTDLERERNYYRDTATPKEEPEKKAPSYEDFQEDPLGTIDKMVEGRMSEVNRRLEDVRAQAFISSKPDFNELQPLMEEELKQSPGLSSLGYDALPVLYKMAKAAQLAAASAKTPKAEVPPPKKEHAETATGKKGDALSKDDPQYWAGKTAKEIEDEIGFAPRA
jgi:hypothetical protein